MATAILCYQIANDFLKNYDETPHRFGEHVSTAFESMKYDKTILNLIFASILKSREWSIEQIRTMINLGADLSYINCLPFRVTCNYTTCYVASYLMDAYDIHITPNVIRNLMANNDYHHLNDAKRRDITKMFLDKGYIFTEEDILNLVSCFEVAKLLAERGYDMQIILRGISHNIFYSAEECTFIINAIKHATFTIEEDTLNEFFTNMLTKDMLSVDDIEIFINAGLDPRYNDDEFFITACGICRKKVVLYFISAGANINAQNGEALYNAISCNRESLIKILLDMNASILDRHIDIALVNSYFNWSILIQYGNISIERVAEVYVKKMFKHLHSDGNYLTNAKRLIEGGIDFNQLIMAHEKIDDGI